MKKVSLILSAVVMTAMILSSCGNGEITEEGASIEETTSTEEGVASEVTIGEQVWMTENLNVDKFRNGDPIPEAKTNEEWVKAGIGGKPAWCYYQNDPDPENTTEENEPYNNDPANAGKYGKLYNWYAVNDPRGLAPEGWKIPSDEDWSRLIDFLGGERVAGIKMKSTDFWADNGRESGNGTNESGFSGHPGGFLSNSGSFSDVSYYGRWWSSTEHDTNNAWLRVLYFGNSIVYRSGYSKKEGFSVRCLRD